MKRRKGGTVSFQFTPLREGRHAQGGVPAIADYFNSRPSARGDWTDDDVWEFLDISIHAPPRGATVLRGERAETQMISIHAPPRGATFDFFLMCPPYGISIHAPPRGATSCTGTLLQTSSNFNSRPSARGDLTDSRVQNMQTDFNSRPSARGDLSQERIKKYLAISIHAPPRGATVAGAHQKVSGYFNSRPSARGDAPHWKVVGT